MLSTSKESGLRNGISCIGGLSSKSSKLCSRQKQAKVNPVYGFACSISEYDLVCDSTIANRNGIILNKAKDIAKDCNILSLSFRELDDVVIEEVCELINRD